MRGRVPPAAFQRRRSGRSLSRATAVLADRTDTMSFYERIKEAAANWKPPTPDEWFERTHCRCHKCQRTMEDGEPVWRIRVGYPGFSIMGCPKTKYSIEHFCRQCGLREAHSDVACASFVTAPYTTR